LLNNASIQALAVSVLLTAMHVSPPTLCLTTFVGHDGGDGVSRIPIAINSINGSTIMESKGSMDDITLQVPSMS
jgi:hypothetical protein